jgi:hypothetical protein
MDEPVRAFLDQNQGAAMITLRADGTPHVTRVGVARCRRQNLEFRHAVEGAD